MSVADKALALGIKMMKAATVINRATSADKEGA